MKRLTRLLVAAALSSAAISSYAQESSSDILTSTDAPAMQKDEVISDNARYWKHNNKLFSLGFSTGSFDLGKYNGGKLNSRWGLGLKGGRNFMVHPAPIAHLVKFGIFVGADVTYLNFEKGHGSLSGITGGYEDDYDDGYQYDYDDADEYVSLGSHYLAAGIAVGPTATVMPFYWCSNPQVARIKVRPFFQVVPSYSALLISNEDELEVHGAFACLFAGGFELMWRKLSIGFEWKGGRARYKNFSANDLFEDEDHKDLWVGGSNGNGPTTPSGKQPRYGCKMFTISLGVEF